MRVLLCIIAAALGMITGAIVGLYIIVKKARREISRSAGVSYSDALGKDERAAVDEVIARSCYRYRKKVKGNAFRKIIGLKKKKRQEERGIDYFGIIRETAEVFNPDSEAPFLELSERQAFDFGHTVTARVIAILETINVPFLDKINFSLLMDSADIAVTVFKKGKVGVMSRAIGILLRIINFVNPFYWMKKILTVGVSEMLMREVVYASIDITAKEFANLYASINADANTSAEESAG